MPSSLKKLLPLLIMASALSHADNKTGLHVAYNDWELACDNTRTCRAAGYHEDHDEYRISLLLIREAGPGTVTKGSIMLGNEDEAATQPLPATIKLTLEINGQKKGQTMVDTSTMMADLSSAQTTALITALKRDSDIEWIWTGKRTWHLSDKGAAAALLKMDDFQGRVGTPYALVKKGTRPENTVLPALPVPTIRLVEPVATRATDQALAHEQRSTLIAALKKTLHNDDYCPQLTEEEPGEISVTRLSNTQLLLSLHCWSGAYNMGTGYWVTDDKAPFTASLVTTSGTDSSGNTIDASHKDRGIGDCWSSDSWAWNGREFLHSASSTAGMCKQMAAGGAWSLPTIISTVR